MPRVTLALLVAAVLMLGYTAHQVSSLSVRIDNVLWTKMQTLTDTWRSHGVTKTVSTTRNAGETDAEFVKRHNDLVKLQQESFPPDNT